MCYRSRLIAILLLGLTGLVSASGTKFWQLDSYQDFSAGKSRGISVTHDGRLVLAPEFSMVFDSGQPYILSATRDKAGNAYFGTGHEGKVYRLDASGKTSVILDVDEADIFAMATDSDGNLYAAASPGGKIYRVQPDGSSSVYVDLGVRYVWSLVSDGQGHLYAGTGVEGKIYRITTGQAELFADLPQMHVLSLTMDLDGNLVAGTAPNGYVIRLNPDGRATSLFDAPHKEIHQLYVDRYGNIYALGIGKETAEDTANATESVEATVSIFAAATAKTTKKKSSQSGSIQTLDAGQQNKKSICALYRIDKSLNVLPLWYSNTVTAYSFYVDADGTAYLGTDEQGRIFSIKEDRFLANLVESGQEQVTVMLRDR